MRALDLFCGAGGASMGLRRAGFEVVGVDIEPMPEYPREPGFTFVQADAFEYSLDGFDLIWASPKCQRYSSATRQNGNAHEYPDQIPGIRERLIASGVPYIIENVEGARGAMRDPLLLCGSMFGLGVIRHRLFECSFAAIAPDVHEHRGSLVTGEYVTVTGGLGVPAWTMKERERRGLSRHIPGEATIGRRRMAMGIDWMSNRTIVQAIPPAYAEYLGRQLMCAV